MWMISILLLGFNKQQTKRKLTQKASLMLPLQLWLFSVWRSRENLLELSLYTALSVKDPFILRAAWMLSCATCLSTVATANFLRVLKRHNL